MNMEILRPDPNEKCECCDSAQTDIVYDASDQKLKKVCERHARLIIAQGNPEYCEVCQNCGCWMPIN